MIIKNNLNVNSLKKGIVSEGKKTGGETNFGDILKDVVMEANTLKKESDAVTNDFLVGKTDNLHEVMISAQKAEVAISFVTEVRNRIMEGYQTFASMQV
jgi:flagellar hook-basal body complex protein FliE